MNNDINELRNILFETLRELNNKENPMDIKRARSISDTAQVIINTAKVEVDYYRATGEVASTNFIPTEIQKPKSVGGYVHRIGERHGLQNTLEKLGNE